ncbi:MAG TPA: bifunctional phosphoribosylaminoimidazolecarboxamide formyltransferase/inosine monophosphate cyclohydrolase [Persephonella sp.]|uniref:Bifunctional purine biosynthesis protein PurH n=1 Tax=Persephonella marina (strain DSM 14350 / EX-H1) TaxID=123214 RepID=PUR9_PERMH|nr:MULTISPECIES: bifunctional phosphoribosylaminoimidazolecarboxamide formyltransferase/IMP cyclohydrolase [Persephonella]C0QRH2.1 RecName: Full=Bifunctional purine biosynthesis protein PurH; Includes: RecName: Full=Phosphoribosylaminoimidazolecarboxamide formyltransferase; AltName: Full=AICAR transformylase; Includes: RecName: Full=IMP cyclohydrolase; AltName: Full=ATIC; AltName: Full=IMP synthase; AltName: Full=Inosinicase [Persephonella marina EX-H1]ACO04517.1 phosphoribosylaminoimidazolecarbo
MGRKALISVSDKTGVVEFAKELEKLGFQIISSSGTARVLKENGIDVTEVSDITGFPEIMGGRVKTLHPKIHGGLLAVRDNPEYMKQLEEQGIEPIDIVAINLYPFEQTVRKGADLDEIIENIDIGGPAMVRASAKNHKFVTIIVDPEDYGSVISELKEKGETSLETRRKLALKAFRHTAFYDSVISSVLNEKFGIDEKFPEEFSVPFRKKDTLRYGENPHQEAAVYISPVEYKGLSVAESEVLHGKEMSYNNFLDVEAAVNLVKEFDETACVIVKHNNPCGVAISHTPEKAYREALSRDPKSAFGGIVAFNRSVDIDTAKALTEIFLEVIVAPDFDKDAFDYLTEKKKNLRLVKIKNFDKKAEGPDYRRISGGILVQDRDTQLYNELKVVTDREPTDKEMEDLLFAWKVVKHVKSNSVVIAKNKATVGIGPGQTSRVDSLETAVKKAEEFNLDTEGSVLASEAFFPFRDSVDQAAKYGIKAIIQPGGSIRDNEVIQAANEHGIAMVFTGMRHFKH